MSITSIQPIPLDIRKELSDPHIPWGINKRIFNEMKSQETSGYKKVQVLPTDPEWRFVWRYFHQDKPNRYNIKKIYCIYEKHQQQAFELNLSSIEREASTFQPTWCQEPRAKQRAKTIERWKQSANIFSPFFSVGADGKRTVWKNAKILPLWYGSSEKMCKSIATSGFVNFEKISLGSSASESIDEGFFGRGIYFTNSARYASDIYSKGHILLAWVSMKEPFPMLGDHCQIDMKAIKGAYKDYNAHYIPVTSINLSNPYATTYHPTKENETPHCDKCVVFNKSQTLPRFWIELELAFPYVPSSDTPQFVHELIPHLMKLLQNPNVYSNQKLRNYLFKELELLLAFGENNCLEKRHLIMYEHLKYILDSQGKVNSQISHALVKTTQATTVTTPAPLPTQSTTLHQANLSSPQHFPNSHPISLKVQAVIPSIAFGKADWEKYFGYVVEEPSLPSNIDEILNAPCSFWPERKVKETHLLMLIPSTVNGNPFTMNYLGDLIQKPKSGHATKYRGYNNYLKDVIGDKSYPSHWVLMTKDVIPGSNKGYSIDCDMVASHSNKTGIPYELPHLLDATTSILMHYVKTGERLYREDPWSYTYIQHNDEVGYLLVVGGFSSEGLSINDGSYYCCGVAVCRKF